MNRAFWPLLVCWYGHWRMKRARRSLCRHTQPATKADSLQFWDDVTAFINENWEKYQPAAGEETDKAMGQYESTVIWRHVLLDRETRIITAARALYPHPFAGYSTAFLLGQRPVQTDPALRFCQYIIDLFKQLP